MVLASSTARKYQELREARGYSVDEVAHHLGVDHQLVHDWESGDAEPDEATLHQLATHYGVSQDAFRHEEDHRHHPAGN